MLIVLRAGCEQGPDGPVGVAGVGSMEQDIAEDYGGGLVINERVALEQALGGAIENVGFVCLPGFSDDVQVVEGIANQRGRHTIDLQVPGINRVLSGASMAEKLQGHLRIGKRGPSQQNHDQEGKKRTALNATSCLASNKHAARLPSKRERIV